mgnify:CR=1 FL=1
MSTRKDDLIGDDAPSPEDHALENDRKEMIRGLLDRLDPRAQLAGARRFGLIDGESHSYREVGEELGVTEPQFTGASPEADLGNLIHAGEKLAAMSPEERAQFLQQFLGDEQVFIIAAES